MIRPGRAAVVTMAFVAPIALRHIPLRANRTASVPPGIYRVVSRPSRYAAICLSGSVIHSAEQAGLRLAPGECPDGREPILKTVYRATPTVPVAFSPSGFSVGGRLLANTRPKLRSKTDVPLGHAAFVTYRDGLWAISDFNPDSFDSRYFGAVPQSNVRYYVVPFFLF